MSTHFISLAQFEGLRKLARRVKRACRMPESVKLVFVQSFGGDPGRVCLTARNWQKFLQLLRLVQQVVPEFRGALKPEHGYGWRTGDRTPYYYTEFYYILKVTKL